MKKNEIYINRLVEGTKGKKYRIEKVKYKVKNMKKKTTIKDLEKRIEDLHKSICNCNERINDIITDLYPHPEPIKVETEEKSDEIYYTIQFGYNRFYITKDQFNLLKEVFKDEAK